MTRVVISQPMYFPWPGFFAQMKMADSFVWLDGAQFSKGSFTNRIQVKTERDRLWMTIPLAGKGSFSLINDLQATNEDWKRGHRDLLRQQLARRPYLADALQLFDDAVATSQLNDTLISSCEGPARYMGVSPEFSRASLHDFPGNSWRRVLDICMHHGATTYITGHGAKNYLDHEAFERSGVKVEYMQYRITPWSQKGEVFTPYVTILDLIAAMGPAASEYLTSGTLDWRQFVTH